MLTLRNLFFIFMLSICAIIVLPSCNAVKKVADIAERVECVSKKTVTVVYHDVTRNEFKTVIIPYCDTIALLPVKTPIQVDTVPQISSIDSGNLVKSVNVPIPTIKDCGTPPRLYGMYVSKKRY